MKILVISDTHGYTANAEKLIKNGDFDYCIHLGDMADDCIKLQTIFPKQKFIFARGNNEFYITDDSLFPYERIFTLENVKFFICHGHKYNVKLSTSLLKSKALDENADIALFGHTHSPMTENDGKITLMNPGNIFSYGTIEIHDKNAMCEIHDFYAKDE